MRFLKNDCLEIGDQRSADEVLKDFEGDYDSIDRYDEKWFYL